MTTFSVDEIIEMAVLIEKSGWTFYDNALKKKKLDPKARELLEKLKDQEGQHEAFFKSILNEKDLELTSYGADQELVNDYLRAIINYQIFNSPDSAIRAVEQSKDELELIKTAISFEKDTLLYFQGIKDVIKDSEAKNILERIILEEFSHILLLSLYRDKLLNNP